MSDTIIRIVIIDDHPVIRHGAKSILDKQTDMTVVGVCSNGESALKAIAELLPDVIVLDITMVGLSGIDLIPYIHQESPDTSIVIYSVHDTFEYVQRAVSSGVKGYVLKGDEIHELLSAIRDSQQGRMYLSRNLPASFLELLIHGTESVSLLSTLTPREMEIANLLRQGMLPDEIGKTLHISHKTARTHRTNIMHKLGFKNTNELILHLPDLFPTS